MCIRLRKTNLGENWLERKIELNNDYLHHPVGEIKSFVLATIFIQQKVADEISQDPASQFFRECILNVDATAVSEKCTILCGRRFIATIMPLSNEVRGGWQIREAQNWAALILLGSRKVLMAKFGIKSGKPWCQILLQPGYVAGIDTNNEHWQSGLLGRCIQILSLIFPWIVLKRSCGQVLKWSMFQSERSWHGPLWMFV